jgi:hypothetical protein
MTQPPILDAIFQGLVTNDQAALEHIQAERSTECLDLRALVSTDDVGGVSLDLGLGITTSAYEGPRAFFISRHTSVQARLIGGRSTVPLDYSLSFDSNFSEKVRAILNDENVDPVERERVVDVLMLRANNARVQFDVVPFLYEASFQMACNECATARVHAERHPQTIAARRAAASALDPDAMRRLVAQEELPWL